MLNSITDTAQGTPKLNLNLMGEGNRLEFSEIEKLKTPTRTKSWRPLPHAQVIDEMRNQADKVGLNIVQEMHLTHRNDSRYFGLFEVQSESKDIASVVGLRNSHDKSFRASICAGDAPFVCSNLCFSNEIVLGRKHTSEILSDLSNIFREALNKFIDSRVDQAKRVEALKNFELTNNQAHDFICRAGRTEAIADAHIGKVITEWHTPEHDEFKDRNMWSLQNAFSNVWRSAPLQTARRSAELNQLIDAELELVA